MRPSGSTVVNLLPTGVGGNADNVATPREADGHEGRGEAQLCILAESQAPLADGNAGPPQTVLRRALSPSCSKAALEGVRLAGGSRLQDDLRGHRRAGARATSRGSSRLCTRWRPRSSSCTSPTSSRSPLGADPGERYVDQLASLIYDLTAIQSSEDVGEPITYLAGAAVKSLENYERYMVEETRDLLRELQLKASRTRVLVAWSGGQVRDPRRQARVTAQSLTEKLQGLCDRREAGRRRGPGRDDLIDSYKHSVAIVCTPADFEWFKGLKKRFRSSEITILKATTAIGRV